MFTARESYDKYEIEDIEWVGAASNIADAFTKRRSSIKLETLLDTGRFDQVILQRVVKDARHNALKDFE